MWQVHVSLAIGRQFAVPRDSLWGPAVACHWGCSLYTTNRKRDDDALASKGGAIRSLWCTVLAHGGLCHVVVAAPHVDSVFQSKCLEVVVAWFWPQCVEARGEHLPLAPDRAEDDFAVVLSDGTL